MRIPTVLAGVVAGTLLSGCDHTVRNPTAPAAAPALVVATAALIELQYPNEPTRWLYAPQVRVTETSGVGPVRITGAEIRWYLLNM